MGISTEAVLIVGLPYKQLDAEMVDTAMDTGELYYASPWYDADREDCIVGIYILNSDTNTDGEVDLGELTALTAKAKKEFLELTGLEGKLYISANVS